MAPRVQREVCWFNSRISSQLCINSMIDKFTDKLYEIMTPYCKSSVSHDICTNNNVSFHKPKTTSADYCNFIEDETRYVNKPWFDESLIRLYTSYKSALRSFNQFKSYINHTLLIQRRKLYKDNEARKKRAYFQKEGKMLSQMRKTDSKTFFSKLRKKKQCIPTQHLFLCLSVTIILNHCQINR